MRRLTAPLVACLVALALCVPAAHADFGLSHFDVTFTEADGTTATQAGSHPFAMTTSLVLNFTEAEGISLSEGQIKDILLEQIPGLLADPTAYQRCSTLDFLQDADCPAESQVGVTAVSTEFLDWRASPVFSLTPPPGVLLRIGWSVGGEANIVIDAGLSPDFPHNGLAASRNTPQVVNVIGVKTKLWGNPSDPAHDALRGDCLEEKAHEGAPLEDVESYEFEGTGELCGVPDNPKPFLTLPTYCEKPLATSYEAFSWEGDFDSGSVLTHDAEGNPQRFTGCGALPPFDPSISAQPTSRATGSPSGLDLSLQIKDEGLTSLGGRAKSRLKDAVITLPEGMTANPSLAEGLEVCSEADLADETLQAAPGEGCPQASKIGTMEVESPLLEEPVSGSLFIAEPYENRFGSLIAFYMVFKNPKLGIIIKQAAEGVPDPETGQLTTVVKDIPQTAAFSEVRVHLREGARSPLITPPACGDYEVTAELTPWSGQAPIEATSSFELVSGPNEGPCPAGGRPPFDPGFAAASLSNAAARFSPFSMRLTRRDGDQDLVRFDATLPPGVGAILAGVDRCPEAQIAQAKAKTGKAELASPSCPLNSRIGAVIGGAGVGSQLTYVRGSLYLAGPFAGAPLSVVAVVPAVAGPFDVGTVAVRQALLVNPRTGVVSADGSRSDPLPHILAGIPLVVRDVQVHVDRSHFTYNPTSCDPFATKASIWGGGLNPFSLADDSPVPRQARYQASSCQSLGFKPRLALKLKGGTRRGDHPKLKGTYRPRPGDANLKRLVLRLPRSAFLDQAHIGTICTRVQFAAHNCPPASIYGFARAFTPVLSEPLEGPVYLRSSDNELPDFVAALHGLLDVEAVARIDSKRGGIRATFTEVPDAPVTKVIVNMQGGKKGLIVNSTNLCAKKNRANARLSAHNAKRAALGPLVRAGCSGRKR
jgi:hypothetical protein